MTQHAPPSSPVVLIVEDDPILMMALVDYVEDAGFPSIEATSVTEAIEILETRLDVRTVLTDLDMRGSTTGMKLAMKIRDRWPPIELVMVSSQPWAERDLPTRGVLLGKPFDERRILSTLRRLTA